MVPLMDGSAGSGLELAVYEIFGYTIYLWLVHTWSTKSRPKKELELPDKFKINKRLEVGTTKAA